MATKTALTPDDLLRMPPPKEGKYYELSGGELITVGKAGARHERIKSKLVTMLCAYSAQHPEFGEVYAESMFPLGPETARIPDVAFVSHDKAGLIPDADVVIPVAPDLAVEVISESESAEDAETKVRQYLAAGVQEVWQVYPRERVVRVRTVEAIRDLVEDQVLETPVLPGFRIEVKTIFAR
jgi:Uma2 family endonuclease